MEMANLLKKTQKSIRLMKHTGMLNIDGEEKYGLVDDLLNTVVVEFSAGFICVV